MSFAANSFRRTEIKCIPKIWYAFTSLTTTLQCSCCRNCSEHNRNCPVSGKIIPVEVAGSSWGSVCVPAGRVRGASASGGSGRGSGASGGGSERLPTSVSPRASSNDRSRSRERYGTFALINARLMSSVAHVPHFRRILWKLFEYFLRNPAN